MTRHQEQIAGMVSTGLRNKDIALHFGVTEQAIKNALRAIYDETGMGNRVELTHFLLARENETATSDILAGICC